MSAIIETLTATLQAAPDSWQCRLALVEALVAEDRIDEASSVLEQVTILPEEIDSRVMAGRAYGLINPASGFEVIDAIIAEDPANAAAHLERARLCHRIGDHEQGKRHYFSALTFNGDLSDPGLAAAYDSPSEAEEAPVETAHETEEAAPALPQPAAPPASHPQSRTREDVYYPAPGEYPVITLREALGLQPAPLVDPATLPALPGLQYEENVTRYQPIHTPDADYREELVNVAIQPQPDSELVTYDYRAPDETIFHAPRNEDEIFVGASTTADGHLIANLQEAIRKHREENESTITIADRRNKILSVLAGLAATTIICLLMLIIVTASPRPNPPQIVASIPEEKAEEIETQVMTKPQNVPTPAALTAGAMAMDVMTTTAVSDVTMQTFDSPGVGMGDSTLGMGFGSSMTFGTGGGSSAMFFGSKSSGQRFLFVLDASISMQPHQVKLRDDELEKTLKTLRGVDYHVMLFAGGAYFADKGWGVKPTKGKPKFGPTDFFSPDGEYSFKAKSLFDHSLAKADSTFPAPKWIKATSTATRKSIKFVKDSKRFSGTDWDNALELAHLMKPSPDVIFFMSDGQDRDLNVSSILSNSKRNGRPKINCIAMQTAEGKESFAELAKGSRGTFTIVDKDGEAIDGFDYIKNPEKYKGRL